ncbi:hypothetical protein EJ06DRAFT_510122 [Trichodelitschia bisporula]|uniref:Nudix hydrolase domain-containing protein n=1 Tax=Trichodelitschia bisporula TaxID=703511 RepID=A0A6G1HVV1_9PEZI|nr:hypothetical protein EJ06DRAFT_510122 [Trichodelitschia bisporula]
MAARSMQSRTGRSNQRYGPHGERLVAGLVPLSQDKYYVLLIQSTGRKGWVLPKGGWETDETAQEAACREAWEEAGIVCTIAYDLGKIDEKRRPEQLTREAPKAEYRFFEATVDKQEAQWPEMGRRSRMWMTFAQAEAALQDRPELLDALRRSTIRRS